jgi:hypothetical protein
VHDRTDDSDAIWDDRDNHRRVPRGIVAPAPLFKYLAPFEGADEKMAGEWHVTENNRRAKYYALTAQGRATLKRETKDWEQQSAAIARIMSASLGEL